MFFKSLSKSCYELSLEERIVLCKDVLYCKNGWLELDKYILLKISIFCQFTKIQTLIAHCKYDNKVQISF